MDSIIRQYVRYLKRIIQFDIVICSYRVSFPIKGISSLYTFVVQIPDSHYPDPLEDLGFLVTFTLLLRETA